MTAAQRARKADFKNRDRFIRLGITIAVLRKLRAFSLEVLYNHASAPDIASGELLFAAASPLYKK
ncbi:MAG: hypothetical protein DBY18_03660 [Clostridia bacterium]|nr:MAG: hypothetical protein DBY18_03660 [Clostridia bacterium]